MDFVGISYCSHYILYLLLTMGCTNSEQFKSDSIFLDIPLNRAFLNNFIQNKQSLNQHKTQFLRYLYFLILKKIYNDLFEQFDQFMSGSKVSRKYGQSKQLVFVNLEQFMNLYFSLYAYLKKRYEVWKENQNKIQNQIINLGKQLNTFGVKLPGQIAGEMNLAYEPIKKKMIYNQGIKSQKSIQLHREKSQSLPRSSMWKQSFHSAYSRNDDLDYSMPRDALSLDLKNNLEEERERWQEDIKINQDNVLLISKEMETCKRENQELKLQIIKQTQTIQLLTAKTKAKEEECRQLQLELKEIKDSQSQANQKDKQINVKIKLNKTNDTEDNEEFIKITTELKECQQRLKQQININNNNVTYSIIKRKNIKIIPSFQQTIKPEHKKESVIKSFVVVPETIGPNYRIMFNLFPSSKILPNHKDFHKAVGMRQLISQMFTDKVKSTKLLFTYDPINKLHYDKYIQGSKNIFLLIKLPNSYIIGGYAGSLNEKDQVQQSFLFSISADREPIKMISQRKIARINKDPLYIKFGSNQLKLKAKTVNVYCCFTGVSSFFYSPTIRVSNQNFTGQSQNQFQAQTYQIYEIISKKSMSQNPLSQQKIQYQSVQKYQSLSP